MPTVGVEPGPPAQQARALSITPLHRALTILCHVFIDGTNGGLNERNLGTKMTDTDARRAPLLAANCRGLFNLFLSECGKENGFLFCLELPNEEPKSWHQLRRRR